MAVRRLDTDIDRLYQLPLDEFTPARNALAKEAGAQGAEIRKLQKPPLPAWAVNQVFWRDRDTYEQLIETAEAVRGAHSAVLAGRRADLRATGKAHEQAVEAALKFALGILEQAGHPASDATRHAVHTTLRSLPGPDPPGRLTGTLQPAGFEQLAGMPVRGRPQEKPRVTKADTATVPAKERERTEAVDPRALRRAKDAATAAARTLKEAEHTARREEFEAARAARDAEKAARAVEQARETVAEAERALADAERDAAAAAKARESTARKAHDASAALDGARERNDSAQAELARLSQG